MYAIKKIEYTRVVMKTYIFAITPFSSSDCNFWRSLHWCSAEILLLQKCHHYHQIMVYSYFCPESTQGSISFENQFYLKFRDRNCSCCSVSLAKCCNEIVPVGKQTYVHTCSEHGTIVKGKVIYTTTPFRIRPYNLQSD